MHYLSKSQFSFITQSCLTLRPHGLRHARLPCPSPTPRAYSNSSPLSQWCHPTISSCRPLLLLPSVFSQHQGLFPMSQFFTSGSQSIGVSQVYYQGWNRSPAQVGCMRQVLRAGALGRPRGMGWGGRREGGSGRGTHVNLWLIHVSVWQKPLQYCRVISLQLIRINGEKKKYWSFSFSVSPSNEYSGLISFRMDWLISLQSKGLSRVFSNTTQFKSINSLVLSFLYSPTLTSIHDYCPNLKNIIRIHRQPKSSLTIQESFVPLLFSEMLIISSYLASNAKWCANFSSSLKQNSQRALNSIRENMVDYRNQNYKTRWVTKDNRTLYKDSQNCFL